MKIELFFNYETEKHVRFDESEDGEKKLGSLYLKRTAWEELGSPDIILVSIKRKNETQKDQG